MRHHRAAIVGDDERLMVALLAFALNATSASNSAAACPSG